MLHFWVLVVKGLAMTEAMEAERITIEVFMVLEG
jgi:hypothetical protein